MERSARSISRGLENQACRLLSDSLLVRVTGLRTVRRQGQRRRSISLQIEPGVPLLVVGSNGSGKTALLRAICGIGLGQVAFERPRGQSISPRISASLDFYGFEGTAKVGCLIDEHASAYRWTVDSKERFAAIVDVFQFSAARGARVDSLSLGTRQMLRLSLCLATPADLYVMDEPFRAVDGDRMVALSQLISQAVTVGAAVLLTAHHGSGLLTPTPAVRDLDAWLALGGVE